MKYNKLSIGFMLAFCLIMLMAAGYRYQVYEWPIFRGNASGYRGQFTLFLSDDEAASSQWLLGDTTAAGMYVPEQAIELQDIKILWDPDSGDEMRVIIYAANGDGANETIVDTDTLTGTAWEMNDDFTISSTYKTVTPTEGLAVRYEASAATPNSVQIIIPFKYRIGDAYE